MARKGHVAGNGPWMERTGDFSSSQCGGPGSLGNMDSAWMLAQVQMSPSQFEALTLHGLRPISSATLVRKGELTGLRRPRSDQEHPKLTTSPLNLL